MGKLDIIKSFARNAWEELDDASHYAELACKWKLMDNSVADMYIHLASEEINHFERIWSATNRYVEELPPEDPARYVWDWQSEDLMDRNVMVTSKMSQY